MLPHLEIDAVHEDLKSLENLQEIGEINGKNPDVILDCLSSTQYKELLVKYALDRTLRTNGRGKRIKHMFFNSEVEDSFNRWHSCSP